MLLELRRNDRIGLRPIEIEQRLLIAQHNVSRLIDRLETEGFVRRESCPADGRGQIVRIKPAGQSLLKRMWPVYGAAIHWQSGQSRQYPFAGCKFQVSGPRGFTEIPRHLDHRDRRISRRLDCRHLGGSGAAG